MVRQMTNWLKMVCVHVYTHNMGMQKLIYHNMDIIIIMVTEDSKVQYRDYLGGGEHRDIPPLMLTSPP